MILKDKSYSSKYPAPSPSIPYCTYARADKGKSSSFIRGKLGCISNIKGNETDQSRLRLG